MCMATEIAYTTRAENNLDPMKLSNTFPPIFDYWQSDLIKRPITIVAIEQKTTVVYGSKMNKNADHVDSKIFHYEILFA